MDVSSESVRPKITIPYEAWRQRRDTGFLSGNGEGACGGHEAFAEVYCQSSLQKALVFGALEWGIRIENATIKSAAYHASRG